MSGQAVAKYLYKIRKFSKYNSVLNSRFIVLFITAISQTTLANIWPHTETFVPSLALLTAAMSLAGESASANVDRMSVAVVAGIVRRPGSLVLDRKSHLIRYLTI